MKKILCYFLLIFALFVSGCSKRNHNSETKDYDESTEEKYERVEKQVEGDFVWYSIYDGQYVGAMDVHKKIIFDLDMRLCAIWYKDGFFFLKKCIKDDGNNRFSQVVAVYRANGEEFLGFDYALYDVDIRHYENIPYLEISTQINDVFYYGVCSFKNLNNMIPPVFEHIVYGEDREYNKPADMFWAELNGLDFGTMMTLNSDSCIHPILFNEMYNADYYLKIKDRGFYSNYTESFYSNDGTKHMNVLYIKDKEYCILDGMKFKYYCGGEGLDRYSIKNGDDYNDILIYNNVSKVERVAADLKHGYSDYCHYKHYYDILKKVESPQYVYPYEFETKYQERDEIWSSQINSIIVGTYKSFLDIALGKSRNNNVNSSSNNNSSSGGYVSYPQNYDIGVNDETMQEREPIRNRCMACSRNPGRCGGCDGSGKIKWHYNSTTGEYIMRECTACNGSGICHSCKGDGWLDEGIDF